MGWLKRQEPGDRRQSSSPCTYRPYEGSRTHVGRTSGFYVSDCPTDITAGSEDDIWLRCVWGGGVGRCVPMCVCPTPVPTDFLSGLHPLPSLPPPPPNHSVLSSHRTFARDSSEVEYVFPLRHLNSSHSLGLRITNCYVTVSLRWELSIVQQKLLNLESKQLKQFKEVPEN